MLGVAKIRVDGGYIISCFLNEGSLFLNRCVGRAQSTCIIRVSAVYIGYVKEGTHDDITIA